MILGTILIVLGIIGIVGHIKARILEEEYERTKNEVTIYLSAINRYNELTRFDGMTHEEANEIVFKEYGMRVHPRKDSNETKNK